MNTVATMRMSFKGRVVIPEAVRNSLGLETAAPSQPLRLYSDLAGRLVSAADAGRRLRRGDRRVPAFVQKS